MKKKVLQPDRIRKINGSFAFIEHRFLRDGFFESLRAVFEMLYQIRLARSDNWQSTSRQAAIYWNNVMKAKILWAKS